MHTQFSLLDFVFTFFDLPTILLLHLKTVFVVVALRLLLQRRDHLSRAACRIAPLPRASLPLAIDHSPALCHRYRRRRRRRRRRRHRRGNCRRPRRVVTRATSTVGADCDDDLSTMPMRHSAARSDANLRRTAASLWSAPARARRRVAPPPTSAGRRAPPHAQCRRDAAIARGSTAPHSR
jgi:hypothetical protein